MKKGFAPILILVILLAVGTAVAIGWYFVNKNSSPENTPPAATTSTEANISTDETASWETYNIKKANFSIKSPTNIVFEDPMPNSSESDEFQLKSDDYRDDTNGERCPFKLINGGRIVIEVNQFEFSGDRVKLTADEKLTQIVDYGKKIAKNNNWLLKEEKIAMIDGQKANRIIYSGNSDWNNSCPNNILKGETVELIATLNKNGIPYLFLMQYFSNDKNMKSTFDQILSTFKFTE